MKKLLTAMFVALLLLVSLAGQMMLRGHGFDEEVGKERESEQASH